MEYKEVSILFCDDCMDTMDMEDNNKYAKKMYIRKCIYYGSAITSILFLALLCIWSFVIVMEVNTIPDHE